jgi:hypothetical protein
MLHGGTLPCSQKPVTGPYAGLCLRLLFAVIKSRMGMAEPIMCIISSLLVFKITDFKKFMNFYLQP